MRRVHDNRGERGFALLAALWAVTLLSTVALALGLEQRSRRLAALNRADEARARAAAEACLAHARSLLHETAAGVSASQILTSASMDPWLGLERVAVDTIRLADAWCTLSFEEAGARLNLNLATEVELARLMVALRIDAALADRLAQTIADWRDADREHRPRGAERDAYLDAGLPVLPDDAPFASVEDLRFVMHMRPELFDSIRPYVTIEGSGRVNVHAAPPEVLLAFDGMTPAAVVVLLEMRRRGERLGHLAELAPRLPAGARADFLPRLPDLMNRLGLVSTEIAAAAEGGVSGGPLRVRGRAFFARAGDRVHRLEERFD